MRVLRPLLLLELGPPFSLSLIELLHALPVFLDRIPIAARNHLGIVLSITALVEAVLSGAVLTVEAFEEVAVGERRLFQQEPIAFDLLKEKRLFLPFPIVQLHHHIQILIPLRQFWSVTEIPNPELCLELVHKLSEARCH